MSVVIPAYNEESRLPQTLQRIMGYLAQQEYDWEILVVDDGSTDATGRVAAEAGRGHPCRVLRNEPNAGKGYSIRRGMLEARGKFRLFSDADLSTPIEELDRFWPAIDGGASVVIGSRALPESRLEVRQPFYREIMGRTFNVLVRMLLVHGIHDTQCGFKLFTTETVEAVFPQMTLSGFAFDVELLMLARRAGLRIVEVPVRWVNSPASRVSALRDSAAMLLDLLRLRFRG